MARRVVGRVAQNDRRHQREKNVLSIPQRRVMAQYRKQFRPLGFLALLTAGLESPRVAMRAVIRSLSTLEKDISCDRIQTGKQHVCG